MNNIPNPNDMMNLIQQFQQFRSTFKGNPKDIVMGMVNSGKISQNQLNELQQAAQQFQRLLK